MIRYPPQKGDYHVTQDGAWEYNGAAWIQIWPSRPVTVWRLRWWERLVMWIRRR